MIDFKKDKKLIIGGIASIIAILAILFSFISLKSQDLLWAMLYKQQLLTVAFLACGIATLVWLFLYKVSLEKIFIISAVAFLVFTNLNILISGEPFVGYASAWDFDDLGDGWTGYYADGDVFGADYPPVAVCMYKVFKAFNVLDTTGSGYGHNYIMTMFYFTCVLLLAFFLGKIFDDRGVKNKNWLIALTILCGPMLFAIERGNTIIAALVLVLGFVAYKDSKKGYERVLADLMLALAANLKLYPAIYGLVLLKEKRWKDAIICFVSGLVMFFSPVIYANDGTVSNFMNEFTGQRLMESWVFEDTIAIKYATMRNLMAHGMAEGTAGTIGTLVLLVTLLLAVATFFMTASKEVEYLMITVIVLYVPSWSFWYVVSFLIIPFALFEFEENDCQNIIRFILYLLLLVVAFGSQTLHFMYPWESQWRILVLFLVTVVFTFINFFRGRKLKETK